MKLRGITFSPVLQASGVTNFHGHGYWFHRYLRPIGLNFKRSTFVSKTSTLPARPGNMPLEYDGMTPREFFPKCIVVKPLLEVALNAVSLSGPGLERLLQKNIWQQMTEPHFLSVMSLAPKPDERKAELRECFGMISGYSKNFRAPIGVQANFSCPNGGLDPGAIIDEVMPILDMAQRELLPHIPLMLKFGPDLHPRSAVKISDHPRCDALCVLNTLLFGKHPTWATLTPPVDWVKLFGTDDPKQSPIARYFPGFPGGLSGAPLRPFLFEWIQKARVAGVTKHINAGGGLLSGEDLYQVKQIGADSVSIGSMALLKPWRVRKSIECGHAIFQN